MRAIGLALLGFLGACSAPEAHPTFQAPTDKAAEAVVRDFLDAAQKGDAQKVAAHVCDVSAAGRERAAAAVKGPLAIQSYEVTRVEPAWVGAEPYFRVDVALKKASSTDTRSLSVRVREGCVDRLLGEPVETAHPVSGEISL